MIGIAPPVPLLGALTITPREYLAGLAIDVIGAILIYRSSERFTAERGSTPWRVPSRLWALLIVMLGLFFGGVLFVIARYTTARRLQAAGPRPGATIPGPTSVLPNAPVAGWYRDPSGRHELRYWDDGRWSEHVMDNGARSTDSPRRRDPCGRVSSP